MIVTVSRGIIVYKIDMNSFEPTLRQRWFNAET